MVKIQYLLSGHTGLVRRSREGRPGRLRPQRRLGPHRLSRVHLQPGERWRSSNLGCHIQLDHPPQDALLHHQPHHPLRAHHLPKCLRILPAFRRRPKDDPLYIHPARPGRVPCPGLEDSTPHLGQHTPPVHVPHVCVLH